ncbi:MAG TPA: ABC transporter ATP-binding protein [Alphaproteobacteria bacterium]|nr:ABC transporter ATP-binding protein [Alphaproteobacteria bacterium]
MTNPSPRPPRLARRVWRQARPFRPHLAAMLLLGLLGTPLALLTPLPLKIAVDSALGDHPLPGPLADWLPSGPAAALAVAVGLVLVAAVLRQLHTVADWVLRDYTAERLVADLRARLFLHTQRLSLLRHETKGSADAIYRIEHDAYAIRQLVIDTWLPFVSSAFALAGMVLVIAALSPRLALAALAVAPLLVASTTFARRRLRDRWHAVGESSAATLAVVHEVLGALRVVKTFGQEEREGRRFLARAGDALKVRVRAALGEALGSVAVNLLIALGTAAVLWLGVSDVMAGRLTAGELLLVMGYLAQLYQPLQAMGGQAAQQQRALAGLERAFALLDEPTGLEDRPGARPLDRARGELAFDGAGFAYPGGPAILRGLSFEVPAGSRVGIVGRTGAGKSSLLSLLIRLYDPTEGAVRLDGVDLRDWRLADLRRQFAVVSQDAVLFSDTVAANIAYARPEASQAEIEAAARAAEAHDFIARLPDGYATLCGERGMRFSGGERQRLSLARAFLRDAPILVLDEPTSAIDVKTEAAVMGSIERLMAGRTSFLITHRLDTLAGCDLLLVLEAGRLATVTRDVAQAVREFAGRQARAAE